MVAVLKIKMFNANVRAFLSTKCGDNSVTNDHIPLHVFVSPVPHRFSTSESLFMALGRAFCLSSDVDFHGSFEEPVMRDITHKARVQSLTGDVWRATGYRFKCASAEFLFDLKRIRLNGSQSQRPSAD